MKQEVIIAVAMALGKSPDAIVITNSNEPLDTFNCVLHLLKLNEAEIIKVWEPKEFSEHFYNEKWNKTEPTAYHPLRLKSLWEATALSNWIIIGNKSDAAIGVVNGTIDERHLSTRFKSKYIVELPSGRLEKRPLEPGQAPLGRVPPRIPNELVSRGEKAGISPEIPPILEGPNGSFSESALGYAAWALDCLRRKHYKDAEAHIVTALRRSGYYK